jgi:hypothetical protein
LKTTLTILFAAAIIAIRVWMAAAVPPESPTWIDVYKDVAHLFVGGLFVAWYIQRGRWQWRLFWLLNAVEVAAAVYSRMGA